MASSSSSSNSMIPGRTALRKSAPDPKQGIYERNRSRDAYKKQMNIFKAKFDANLREYDRLDLDAKQEIRIRAKRQREICLNDYRQGLLGLARSSFRRTYKDVFLGERETSIDSYDTNVLEYELRLTSEMDAIIDNIRILSADKSNLSKMDWFSNLARAKFSYEYELSNEIDPDSLPVRLDEESKPLDTNSVYSSQQPDGVNRSEIDPNIIASSSSSGYVYRPFTHRNRHNLYRAHTDDDEDQPPYRYNWQQLYDTKPRTNDDESQIDQYDYEPFQPFCDQPIALRRNRYPDCSLDPEWQSKSSVYAYHRPRQPVPRFTPISLSNTTNIDSICPIYYINNEDDELNDDKIAGIDYEYKPIIPSYIRNNSNSRFNYDDQLNYNDEINGDQNNNLLNIKNRREHSASLEPQFSRTPSLSSTTVMNNVQRFNDNDDIETNDINNNN